jgi:hypothetical protein
MVALNFGGETLLDRKQRSRQVPAQTDMSFTYVFAGCETPIGHFVYDALTFQARITGSERVTRYKV